MAAAQVDEGPTGAPDRKHSASSLVGVKPRKVGRRKDPPEQKMLAATRKREASAKLTELGIEQDSLDQKRRRCGACSKYWKTTEYLGEVHAHLGKGKQWCPFIDDPRLLAEARFKTQNLTSERYKRYNTKR